MSLPLVSSDDLGTYLNVASIDAARADQILWLAQTLCESVVTPLPTGAEAVILDVAARAWVNPTNSQTTSDTAGPFSETTSYSAVAGGLWLTRQNKAVLRRLAGSGGAFTIDAAPATAGTSLPWWDTGTVPYGYGDYDRPW